MPNNNSINVRTTQYNVLVGSSTNTVANIAPPATEQLLISQGAAANPAFGTSTTSNFAFSASNAGANKTFTVSNTSNTANSQARKVIKVAGGSGGDPQTSWINSTTWSEGLDNSDGDAYKVSSNADLGFNNIMRISTAGEINYPVTACFSAYLSSSASNVTGDGTVYTIICDTEITDRNNGYDTITGQFFAPASGKYIFWAGFQLNDLSASFTSCYMKITTSNRNYFPYNVSAASMRDASNNLSLCATVICDMDASDSCKLEVMCSGGTKTVDVKGDASTVFTYFMGKLYA